MEVLRGPQSIMFGKNTIGGALSVISARPTEELGGELSALYGEDGELEMSGVISGPITDRLSGRLAARHYEMDGYMENTLTGNDAPEREDQSIRALLTWDATDTLTANFKYEYSEFENTEFHSQIYRTDPLNAEAAALQSIEYGTGRRPRGI